jgi:SAM-dependent methyltransferase
MIGRLHSQHVLSRRVRVLAAHLAGLLPAEAEVLDVGCGDGQIARLVMEQKPGLRLSGVDVVPRATPALPIAMFDGRTLPCPDGSKDAVMFVDVLHHTEDPMVLLREAARVSRRWVLIKDHHRDGLLAGPTLRFMDWVGNARFGVPLPYNYWPRRRWDEAFATLGLTPEKTITSLGLYPAWADWVFGRGLHFVTLLRKNS